MKKRFFLLPILLICFAIVGFISEKSISFENELPSGTIKIDANFYGDRFEISNSSWCEYVYWTKKVFGENSEQHLASLPDLKVWAQESPCLLSYSVDYLEKPIYGDHPVVGITQEQALLFCKWRSDRVFERLLIEKKAIKENPHQHAGNYFSIEHYYQGKYNQTPPDLRYNTYPHYKLPTEKEWIKLKDHFQETHSKSLTTTAFNVVPCNGDSLVHEPIRSIRRKNSKAGFYIYGNVSEWLEEEDQCIGGNWKDTSTDHFNIPTTIKAPTAYIGFRAVFEWKKWN